MYKQFIRKNKTTTAIFIFIISFIIIQRLRPAILYNRDGSIRPFGIGRRYSTVIPIWLVSLILGILSYLLVLFYLSNTNINF